MEGNYNYDSFGQCDNGAAEFRAAAKVGSEAPDFTLTDLDGNAISLMSFRGNKHVLWSLAALRDRPLWGRFLHSQLYTEATESGDFSSS
jgi:hypothetical protein